MARVDVIFDWAKGIKDDAYNAIMCLTNINQKNEQENMKRALAYLGQIQGACEAIIAVTKPEDKD